MSATPSISSILHNATPQYRAYISDISKQYKVPEESVVCLLMFCAWIQGQKGSSETLDSDRVTKEAPKGAEDIGKVPAVATVAHSLEEEDLCALFDKSMGVKYDPRLAISDFTKLPEVEALKTIDFILKTSKPKREQIVGIYAFFSENPERFNDFLRLGDLNTQFEAFLSILDEDLLNDDQPLMKTVIDAAFSYPRFESIQIQNDEVSPELISEMRAFEQSHLSKTLQSDIASLSKRSPLTYQQWLMSRSEGSATLSNPTNVTKDARANWMIADQAKSSRAEFHGKSQSHLGFSSIRIIHKKLTRAETELDVPHPGEIRKGTARSSRSTELYPPAPFLEGMTQHYQEWLNREIELCHSGKKSIILTAAQAYQRLVAIHPFENGNGRISRMMMDYVLERFGLPPAVLGKNILDAVYALKPKSLVNGEAFVRKVFEGVKQSHAVIHSK